LRGNGNFVVRDLTKAPSSRAAISEAERRGSAQFAGVENDIKVWPPHIAKLQVSEQISQGNL